MRKKCVSPVNNVPAPYDETGVDALRDSLIKAIVATRHEKGFAQERIEAESGVPQASIYRLERGIHDPQLSTMIRVLRPMGMTLAVVPIKPSSP
ncbi:MAG: helix-turn-helix transcriptional regulator [Dehalococcoidia bacterium]|nr:helix-turn-helix transcriptional regulator [Dehalococcoidia bacterium]